jgi:hypothetical protein
VVDATDAAPPPAKYVYDASDSAEDKIRKIARTVYGAKDVAFAPAAEKSLERARKLGYGALPICMAKTQLSLSDDPKVPGRPEGFVVNVRDVRISAGAGFLVPLTGEMMTMPGLPKEPRRQGRQAPERWLDPRAYAERLTRARRTGPRAAHPLGGVAWLAWGRRRLSHASSTTSAPTIDAPA